MTYVEPEIVWTHVASRGGVEIHTGGGVRRLLAHPDAAPVVERLLECARELDIDPIDMLREGMAELMLQDTARDPAMPRDSWPS